MDDPILKGLFENLVEVYGAEGAAWELRRLVAAAGQAWPQETSSASLSQNWSASNPSFAPRLSLEPLRRESASVSPSARRIPRKSTNTLPEFHIAQKSTFAHVQCRVPVDLENILDVHGRIVYSFSRTLAFLIFSESTAKWLVKSSIGHPRMAIFHIALIGFYGSILCLGMIQFGVGQNLFLAGMTVMYMHISFLALLLLDLHIAYLLIRRSFFWTELILTTAGGVALSALIGFDYRIAIAPITFLVFFASLCMDATPSLMRHYVTLPFSICMAILVIVVGLLVNLSRFPGQRSVTFSVGNVFGAASGDISYDVLSLCSSAFLAMFWVSLYMIKGAYRGRKTGELATLSLPLIAVDEAGTNDIINENLIKNFPWLKEGERKGIEDPMTVLTTPLDGIPRAGSKMIEQVEDVNV